jgi:hypothetical protein
LFSNLLVDLKECDLSIAHCLLSRFGRCLRDVSTRCRSARGGGISLQRRHLDRQIGSLLAQSVDGIHRRDDLGSRLKQACLIFRSELLPRCPSNRNIAAVPIP